MVRAICAGRTEDEYRAGDEDRGRKCLWKNMADSSIATVLCQLLLYVGTHSN